MAWTGTFSHLSHARYIPRPSRNEFAMRCEASVIPSSACCYFPGPHIQPPHRSALQPPHSVSMAHHASLFIVINNGEGQFKFHSLQLSLFSCNLLSRISTLIAYKHATKAYKGRGGIAPPILKFGAGWRRVLSLALQPLYVKKISPATRQMLRRRDLLPVT
jgi:hypothetical protein